MIQFPHDNNEIAYLAEEAGQLLLTRAPFLAIKPTKILEVTGSLFMQKSIQEHYPDAAILTPKDLTTAANIDIIIANFYLSWHENWEALLREWRRFLKPNGVVMFNALGLDTLQEYRKNAQAKVIPQLQDMHNIGDALMQSGFLDPVLDVSYYRINYHSAMKMQAELQAMQMIPDTVSCNENTVTYEIISAHAFLSSTVEGVTKIPLAEMKLGVKRR